MMISINSDEVERVARNLCAAEGIDPDSIVKIMIPWVVGYNPVKVKYVVSHVPAWEQYTKMAIRAAERQFQGLA